MAGPYPCDGCGGQEVAMVSVTNVETGETTFYGAGCFARFGLAMAKEIIPAEEIAETLGPLFIKGGKTEQAPRTGKAAGKRAGAAEESAKPPEPATEAVEGQPAAAADGGD